MNASICKLLVIPAILFLFAQFNFAQDESENLENLEKVLLTIDWRGNVGPFDIGIDRDSLAILIEEELVMGKKQLEVKLWTFSMEIRNTFPCWPSR